MNNDEHSLIATYCQALTLQNSERAAFLQSAGLGAGGGTTGDKSIELEEVLHKLNERNNSLQREYEALARLNGDSQVWSQSDFQSFSLFHIAQLSQDLFQMKRLNSMLGGGLFLLMIIQ